MRQFVTLGVALALGASLRAQDPALHLVTPCPQGTHTIKTIAGCIDRDEIARSEGTAARLIGYLKAVKKEGGETCNCGLKAIANTDVHLAIVDKKNDNESDSDGWRPDIGLLWAG